MRDDFCAFILTHGRPDRLYTLDTLKRCGYTGKVYIVIDNEDKTADEYKRRYGDMVLQFDKAAIAKMFDEGDNFNDRRAIIYARNACFDLAKQVKCRYFIQLDDDYQAFDYRHDADLRYVTHPIKSLEIVLNSILDFYIQSPFFSLALSQGGDHIGGAKGGYSKKIFCLRKAMNTFICDTERPFQFIGRINEDVNTYTESQRRGFIFCTLIGVSITQKQTQSNAGGMTDLYLDSGTYVKSFYSVMYAPSCVKVKMMQSKHGRLHHSVNWNAAAPCIVREEYRKVAES